MGNQLVNSMVRGFGLTLGRQAAQSLTAPRPTKQEVSLSRKQLEIIGEYESQIKELELIQVQTEGSYKDGKITEGEYDTLKYQTTTMLEQINIELDKVKSISNSKSSVWPTLIGIVIGFYAVVWIFKLLSGI